MQKEPLIHCLNPAPYSRRCEPIRVGVPFAQGVLKDKTALALYDPDGKEHLLQTLPLGWWPDGTVKWLLCDFLADLPPSSEAVFRLQRKERISQDDGSLQIQKKEDYWRIATGAAVFIIDNRILRPFISVQVRETNLVVGESEVHLNDSHGQDWVPKIDHISIEADGPVRATLFLSGGFRRHKKELVRFEARLHLFTASARVALELRLHNPKAAVHPNNLWDLGDPASVLLRDWTFVLPLFARKDLRLRLRTDETNGWYELDSQSEVRLYQESSGGKYWDSPVHRDRRGKVPMTFRGWQLSSRSHLISQGLRAQPVLWWGQGENVGVSASIDYFWQRFPKAVALSSNGLLLTLFPPEFPGGHELQGGEQVTEMLRFDFAAPIDCQTWGIPTPEVRCDPGNYRASGVFPEGLWQPADPRYAALSQSALSQKSSFFCKREKIDEYGWRNFGEVPADHESAYHRGDRPFISHYNNQYDLLNSFYRLYLAGDDVRWGGLARELAAHLSDIDIYHTDQDREEYCHGLFWHTDHYLDAGLSTHRMSSREHLTQKNPAFCGGGPAAEHCYSSGLTMHYYLTGDLRSRSLVLSIADWCWQSLRGSQTIGAALIRATKGLSKWRSERKSVKIWSYFPFSRGTANCLNSTLDAFELTNDHRFLSRAARLIQGTVHPEDNLADRDLLNAELSWSYTVFLVALSRFIRVKADMGELDIDYLHARDSFLTYTRWMSENEYPYLEKPEILEYPNETWAGQDLRKGHIFFQAANLVHGPEQLKFKERSLFFLNVGFDELLSRDTSFYTRPLALILQNGWVVEAINSEYWSQNEKDQIRISINRRMPHVTFKELLRRSVIDLLSILPKTGLRQEWNWVRFRLMRG